MNIVKGTGIFARVNKMIFENAGSYKELKVPAEDKEDSGKMVDAVTIGEIRKVISHYMPKEISEYKDIKDDTQKTTHIYNSLKTVDDWLNK